MGENSCFVKMDMKKDSTMANKDHSVKMKKDSMKMAGGGKKTMQMDKMKGMEQGKMPGMDMFSEYGYACKTYYKVSH